MSVKDEWVDFCAGLVNIPWILLCFINKNPFIFLTECSTAAETSHHDFIPWARNPPIKFYLVGLCLFCLYFFLWFCIITKRHHLYWRALGEKLFVKYNFKTKTHLATVEIKIYACIPFPPSFVCFLYSLLSLVCKICVH